MALRATYEHRHLQFVTSIETNGLFKKGRLNQTMDQLFETLEIVRSKLTDKDIHYFAIDILNRHKAGEEFAPWGDVPLRGWILLAGETSVHDRLKEWLVKLETLIMDANAMPRSTASLWEDEEVQFGEPAASAFALRNASFVPFYTRLLQIWDMGHAVNQSETIKAIVETHGICPEVEQLLLVRANTAYGEDQIEGLFPYLQQHYGDFPNSALFRRIVEALHSEDRASRLKHKGLNLDERKIFCWPNTPPPMREKAAEILAELDATAGPLD